MKILIRSIEWNEERADNARHLASVLPNARVLWDERRDSYEHMMLALREAGDEGCLHLEDDVELTSDFMSKVVERINTQYKAGPGINEIHQFFSKRTADLTIGTRLVPGRDFSFTCAFYLPGNLDQPKAADFLEKWPKRAAKPTWFDYALADYFSKSRRSFYIHVPSLVQHRSWRSSIDTRRGTTNRQSPTFVP